MHELQKEWKAAGKPKLDIGIGLNSGVASVGNMGSALSYGYTALGDTVNLSSRLEGLNKDYGTHIFVNETTIRGSERCGFVFRELDRIRVKGKTHPVVIYELVVRPGEALYEPGRLQMRLDRFAQAPKTVWTARQWTEAQSGFSLRPGYVAGRRAGAAVLEALPGLFLR